MPHRLSDRYCKTRIGILPPRYVLRDAGLPRSDVVDFFGQRLRRIVERERVPGRTGRDPFAPGVPLAPRQVDRDVLRRRVAPEVSRQIRRQVAEPDMRRSCRSHVIQPVAPNGLEVRGKHDVREIRALRECVLADAPKPLLRRRE